MPGGDGSGPLGWGPRTGRGAGFCAGFNVPGYRRPFPGAGPRGYAPVRYGRTFAPLEEKTILQRRASDLKSRLQELETRLQELYQEPEGK